jgi:hypothetical protein
VQNAEVIDWGLVVEHMLLQFHGTCVVRNRVMRVGEAAGDKLNINTENKDTKNKYLPVNALLMIPLLLNPSHYYICCKPTSFTTNIVPTAQDREKYIWYRTMERCRFCKEPYLIPTNTSHERAKHLTKCAQYRLWVLQREEEKRKVLDPFHTLPKRPFDAVNEPQWECAATKIAWAFGRSLSTSMAARQTDL